MQLTPFHIAVPVRDIDEARDFYNGKLGFPEGRSDSHWIDFDMFGHQFVTHFDPTLKKQGLRTLPTSRVDNHRVPVPHCGVILNFSDWETFAEKTKRVIDDFIIEPYIRFKGQPGEQGTLFFTDPSGNALEFKGFRDIEADLFKK